MLRNAKLERATTARNNFSFIGCSSSGSGRQSLTLLPDVSCCTKVPLGNSDLGNGGTLHRKQMALKWVMLAQK
jgi:hypothetical protein